MEMKEFKNEDTLHEFKFEPEDINCLTVFDEAYVYMLWNLLPTCARWSIPRCSKRAFLLKVYDTIIESITSEGRLKHINMFIVNVEYTISTSLERILKEWYNIYYSKIERPDIKTMVHLSLDLHVLYSKIIELRECGSYSKRLHNKFSKGE